MEQKEIMIRLKGITKAFPRKKGTLEVLHGIDLDIEKGEIFGIIGLSGAGKSTLVRCINLLERPTEGQVYLDGQELTCLSEKDLRQARRSMGMIFQQFHLLMQRTAMENVCFPMEIAGVKKAEAREKAKELLESAGWVDSDGDGIREKDGAKLSVTLDYITNQGTMDDAALVIAQELGEVGFEVTPRGSDNMTWFTQVSTDFDFSLHTTYGGYYDPFLTMTNMNPEMMSDPILWQVALTMENGTDTIKELDSTADLDRVQEIYSEVLTFAADQAVLVPFTSAHQYAAFNSDKIDSFSFGSDQLFIEIANVKAK